MWTFAGNSQALRALFPKVNKSAIIRIRYKAGVFMEREKIVVLDFGSQYAHLIAKRFRMMGYYSEIALPSAELSVLEGAKGIVFSGGPASVYEENVPEFNEEILSLNIPILGLCYGHQLMAKSYGGSVGKAEVGEFGIAHLTKTDAGKVSPLFEGIQETTQVWMSHQDGVLSLGEGFEVIGTTKDCPFAAVQNLEKKRWLGHTLSQSASS